MKIWCLFEQSGTFKNAFKELGYEAYDVDILNDFGETDFQVDIFAHIKAEIEILKLETQSENTIFSKIAKDDLVFAFFPCTKFTEKSFLNTRCKNSGMKNYSDIQRLIYSSESVAKIAEFYDILTKLCEISLRKGFKMVVENPNSSPHFLNLYFPFKPAVSIFDRSKYGDYYKKPMNFWFFNFQPSFNFIMSNDTPKGRRLNMSGGKSGLKDKNELLRWFEKEHGIKCDDIQKARSLISPKFAKRFIKEFVL